MKDVIFFLLLTFAMAGNVQARTYTVELLAFQRDDPAATDYYPPQPGEPDYANSARLDELGFYQSSASSGKLGPEEYTLQKNGQGKTLLHLVWRQSIPGRLSPSKIHISSDPAGNAGEPPVLEGVISLGAGRFHHIGVDLLLRGARIPDAAIGKPQYQYYRMAEHRKMRSGELHYIDHPKMGILVRIDR